MDSSERRLLIHPLYLKRVPRRGEQCLVENFSYKGYSPPKCTCNDIHKTSNHIPYHYKKITVLQWIFSLQIRSKPIKIRCKSLLATDLQQKCYIAKNLVAIFAHFGIRLQKTNRFATKLFRCYIATNFSSVANSAAKSKIKRQ